VPSVTDINWESVTAALPAIGAVIKTMTASGGRGLEARAKRHAELISQLPDSADKAALMRTLNAETAEIANIGDQRLHRRIDWGTVATMGVIAAVSAAAVLLLFAWSSGSGTYPWAATLMRFVAVGLALLAFLLIVVGGLPQVWRDAREPGTSKSSGGPDPSS